MKTYNYLIVAFAALAFVGCSDNDYIGDDPNITPENQTNGEITFAAVPPTISARVNFLLLAANVISPFV